MRKWTYFNEEKEPMIRGVDAELMAALDRARHRAGIPFIVTSGYRTPEDNFAVGGVTDSAHVSGHAIDLRCTNSRHCFLIVRSLVAEGLRRIVVGIRLEKDYMGKVNLAYHNVHVDNDADKPQDLIAIKLYGEVPKVA